MSLPLPDRTTPANVTAADVLHAVGATTRAAGVANAWEPWERIAPLTARRLLPPFPMHLLPSWVRVYVGEVTEALQVPGDLPGCLAIAALAVATGGRVDVIPMRGWVEPTNVYVVVALAPGSRKSAAFSAMTRPLYDAEAALVDSTAPERMQAALVARRANAQADKAARAAESADANPNAALAEAISAAQDAAGHIEYPEPRLLADDLTPETAASLLAVHGGRLALMSAEGGAFATVTGTRYSATPNLEPLLKAHAGDMIRVDRKGRPSERVERPALTIGITTQPENLAEIATSPGARDRGLLARFLYAVPENTVGHRKVHAAPVTDTTRTTYGDQLSQLVLDLAALPERATLTLTPAAVEILGELERWLEPRLDPEGGALASVTDWASKMAGTALRLAGLLHMAEHGAPGIRQPIPAPTMSAAIELARYFLAHSLAVFDLIGDNPETEAARRVLDWITRTKPATFTQREAHRALTSRRFPTSATLTAPLALLIEHGHIRPAPRTTGTTGRPSAAYETHPDLL